jgi:hypothetical protein
MTPFMVRFHYERSVRLSSAIHTVLVSEYSRCKNAAGKQNSGSARQILGKAVTQCDAKSGNSPEKGT